MTKPVVVGTDGSPCADRAVEWAAADAVRRGCPLRIVHAMCPWDFGPPAGFPPETPGGLVALGEHVLAQAADLAGKAGVHGVPGIHGIAGSPTGITTELVVGAPAVALRARAGRSREIVVGYRGHGGAAGLLLGSTSLEVAGRASCPVIVVRGEAGGDRREVLAAVDPFGDGVPAILEFAFESAALRDCWVRVLHIWTPPAGGITRPVVADAQERLARLVAPWRPVFPAVRVIEETASGDPAADLIARSGHADLIVLGPHRARRPSWAHGSQRSRGPHCGRTARDVIRHADCPVAVLGRPGPAGIMDG